MQKKVGTLLAFVLAFLILAPITITRAADPCEPVVGRLVAVEGSVDVQRSGSTDWAPAALEAQLCQGDTIRAGGRSRAAVSLINQAVLRVDQNSALRLVNIREREEDSSLLGLIRGALQAFSRKPRRLEVNSPYLNGAIEGTEFVFRVKPDQSILTVFEGTVLASNAEGSVSVGMGQSVVAEAGRAPQPRTMVRPRDAAQWALFYPPVLAALGGSTEEAVGLPPSLRTAAESAGRGDTAAAFDALDRVSAADRDARFYSYRAALLLSVGQVDEARSDIDRALAADAEAGLAHALRAVVNVVQNNNAEALDDANRAVALSPDAAAAKIALSYAQQANFQIDAARHTLQRAVEQQPSDPLAWARLGELWLMLGNSRESRAAAQRATELAPNISRTQLVLGYAALAEFRNADAMAAFERAIELSSSDPIAHLGRGLAKVSSGRLEEGRTDLEVAVGLDSNSALLRAYLGKSYFEERRHPLDSEQYSIAKQLDPQDPTAYLYHGILKQTVNRPIEAVADLERSIELNDNRAVYRSRLLLDKDRAARGTSLARAYQDLGFTQLAVNASTQSLNLDPSNASAHRFLSDSYRDVPRAEIARVSELLQAQLMQDVNINPVQPSLSETDLNIVALGGPATAGFNEFTPLFVRNQAQVNAAGFGGDNDTYGGEAVASGLYERVSFSAGAFYYKTDGWRSNNDLKHEIQNIYAQAAVTPQLNLQAEFLSRETDAGDLAFNFDPDDFVADRRVNTERDSARIGVRYAPNSASSFLVSYIHSKRDERRGETDQIDPFTIFSVDTDLKTKGYLFEGQYLYQAERFNLVTGAAYSHPKTSGKDEVVISDVDFGPLFQFREEIKEKIKHPRAYVYANIESGDALTWTLGASYDDLTEEPIDETSFNPKFGARWDINDAYQLRAAAFKVLKPSLINNRTIEPTQVAGFNQLFDDATGTESWRYGAAIDARVTRNLSWGAELTWRDLDVPIILVTETGKEEAGSIDQDEELHRLYLYWTPTRRIAVTANLIYDRFEEPSALEDLFRPVPAKVETISLPVGATYFHPQGFFASVVGTYVDQEVTRAPDAVFAQGDDNFFLIDVAVGYRFPKRRGIASVGIKNLFDEEFRYQDNSFREFSEDASAGPYFPERMILGRVAFDF